MTCTERKVENFCILMSHFKHIIWYRSMKHLKFRRWEIWVPVTWKHFPCCHE